MDYNKFYSKFNSSLNTIGDKFDLIQNRIDNNFSQTENIRSITGYIDMLQKMLSLVQQLEEQDKKKKKND